jgi:hypothetical protein
MTEVYRVEHITSLTLKYLTCLERLAKDKCSSLFGLYHCTKVQSLFELIPAGVNFVKLFSSSPML